MCWDSISIKKLKVKGIPKKSGLRERTRIHGNGQAAGQFIALFSLFCLKRKKEGTGRKRLTGNRI
jgi:hypothetical protein